KSLLGPRPPRGFSWLAPRSRRRFTVGGAAAALCDTSLPRRSRDSSLRALEREVETALIAGEVLRSGRRLYYPIIDRQRRLLKFGGVTGVDDLRPGAFGILEPPAAAACDPHEFGAALICAPWIAFTPAAARPGRRGRFYDR